MYEWEKLLGSVFWFMQKLTIRWSVIQIIFLNFLGQSSKNFNFFEKKLHCSTESEEIEIKHSLKMLFAITWMRKQNILLIVIQAWNMMVLFSACSNFPLAHNFCLSVKKVWDYYSCKTYNWLFPRWVLSDTY